MWMRAGRTRLRGKLDTLHDSAIDLAGAADPLTYKWDFNGDTVIDAVRANPTFDASTIDGNASSNYTVKLYVTDDEGNVSTATTTITVANVAPTANAGGPYSTIDDTAITLTGTATDPAGALDPLTYAWDLDNNGTFLRRRARA